MIIPQELKLAFWTSAAILISSTIYSIFMAWVNWKQSKVHELMKENNKLLQIIIDEFRKK